MSQQPIARIVSPLHLIYTGTNGSKTYGVTVRSEGTQEEIEKKGLSREWIVNDYMLLETDLTVNPQYPKGYS